MTDSGLDQSGWALLTDLAICSHRFEELANYHAPLRFYCSGFDRPSLPPLPASVMTVIPILKLLSPNLLHPSHSNLQTFRPSLFCLSTLGGSYVTMSLYVDIPLITRLFPITMNADFVSGDEKRDSSGTFAFAAKKTMKNNTPHAIRDSVTLSSNGDPWHFHTRLCHLRQRTYFQSPPHCKIHCKDHTL